MRCEYIVSSVARCHGGWGRALRFDPHTHPGWNYALAQASPTPGPGTGDVDPFVRKISRKG